MNEQTEKKKPERKSTPPERTSNPPGEMIGGTPTQKLHKTLGNAGVLIESAIVEKVDDAVRPVTGEIDELKERLDRNDDNYTAALGEAVSREETAQGGIEAVELNTRTLEGVKDEFGEMKAKFIEHGGKVEEYKVKVDGVELNFEQLREYITIKDKGFEFRAKELEHDFKETVERIKASTKAEVAKLSGVFLEAMKEFELMQKGLNKRVGAAEKEAENAKKIVEEARTIAHDVEAHVEGAKDIASDVASRQEDMASEVSGLGRQVDQVRTSMLPPPAPVSAEEEVKEPSGVERMPPPPVKKVSNGKEIEATLEENNQILDKREENISNLKELATILLDRHDIEGLKETEAVKPLDITEYQGYEKLTEVSKKRLGKLAEQRTRMREQGAELKAIYEATGRLARRTGVEMKTPPPREAGKIAIENEQELESITINGNIANVIKQISTELKKQERKENIIVEGLKAVMDVNTEGELNG